MTELIMITVCIVLFIVIRSSLENAKFPGNNTVLAVCVSLLCLIGMRDMLLPPAAPPADSGDSSGFDFVVLPYAALGITMLLVLLFMGHGKLLRRNKRRGLKKERKFYQKLAKDKDDQRLWR